eukprot:3713914-Ditylum_brightwellii.AAC.1
MFIRFPQQQEQNNDMKTSKKCPSSGALSAFSSTSNVNGGNIGRDHHKSVPQDLSPPTFISVTDSHHSLKPLEKRVSQINYPPSNIHLVETDTDQGFTYPDLLYEGQNYLAMSMLIYMFAQLREMAIL